LSEIAFFCLAPKALHHRRDAHQFTSIRSQTNWLPSFAKAGHFGVTKTRRNPGHQKLIEIKTGRRSPDSEKIFVASGASICAATWADLTLYSESANERITISLRDILGRDAMINLAIVMGFAVAATRCTAIFKTTQRVPE
jgi:hypothetical protein